MKSMIWSISTLLLLFGYILTMLFASTRQLLDHKTHYYNGLETTPTTITTTKTMIIGAPPSNAFGDFLLVPHGCTLHRVYQSLHCHVQNLKINPTYINCSMGGENVTDVLGRTDSDELPTYSPGALQIMKPFQDNADQVLTRSHDPRYIGYIRNFFKAIQVSSDNLRLAATAACNHTITTPTLLITRNEYANLYHQLHDWYNAYFTIQLYNKKLRKKINNNYHQYFNLIFLDGHAQSPILDDVWKRLFAQHITYVKQLPSPTCISNALFIPPGPAAPINSDYRFLRPEPEKLRDFTEYVLNTYNVRNIAQIPGHIVLIERVPYTAHPRRTKHHPMDRYVSNWNDVAQQLQTYNFSSSTTNTNTTPVTVEIVQLERMTFQQQLQTLRKAHIVIANHGAALTHSIFLNDHAHVLELTSGLGMFHQLLKWKPTVHHQYLPKVVNQTITQEYMDKYLLDAVQKILLLLPTTTANMNK